MIMRVFYFSRSSNLYCETSIESILLYLAVIHSELWTLLLVYNHRNYPSHSLIFTSLKINQLSLAFREYLPTKFSKVFCAIVAVPLHHTFSCIFYVFIYSYFAEDKSLIALKIGQEGGTERNAIGRALAIQNTKQCKL